MVIRQKHLSKIKTAYQRRVIFCLNLEIDFMQWNHNLYYPTVLGTPGIHTYCFLKKIGGKLRLCSLDCRMVLIFSCREGAIASPFK